MTPGELEQARTLYDEAQAALQRGDFVTYAERITELGQLLEEAEAQQTGNVTAAA